MSEENNKIDECLRVFKNECEDFLFYNTNIPVVTGSIDPLRFYRDFVSKNQPVLIKNAIKNWPAVEKWGIDYFRKQIGGKKVTVAVTPNGYADGIAKPNSSEIEYFLLPEEQKMTMNEFLDNIENPKDNYVCYIQTQNSNMKDFPEIMEDVKPEVSWASKAFDKFPDAVNFWMGDTRAITSMHKDPYENIYCVISGYKYFTLLPPCALPQVPYKTYPVASFHQVTSEGYKTLPEERTLSWISAEPSELSTRLHTVTVGPGDCLYLPSLWFHHVRQSQGCIAVNYWYDMDFDIKYCYYKLLEELCKHKNQ